MIAPAEGRAKYFNSPSLVHHCDKAENPCKNEGVCEKNGDEFVCKCNEDWTGDTCEEKGRTKDITSL